MCWLPTVTFVQQDARTLADKQYEIPMTRLKVWPCGQVYVAVV